MSTTRGGAPIILTVSFIQIGSFQKGPSWESENPLEEVWSRVAQVGSREHIKKRWTPERLTDAAAINSVAEYANVRVRQAVEFRAAARGASQLTSPLSLYYSFLNLLRGFYALKRETVPVKGHGLTFRAASSVLGCECLLAPGSFTAYLDAEGASWAKGQAITLRSALARIVEIRDDFPRVADEPTLVDYVAVRAHMSGEVFFDFQHPDGLSFRADWAKAYPALEALCDLEPEGNVLKLRQSLPEYDDVANFLPSLFEADLRLRMSPRWFAQRHVPQPPVLPRMGYYFVAMFVLGSIVRYEPELVREIADPDHEVSWLIGRFLNVAERFFPQLIFNWLTEQTVYY